MKSVKKRVLGLIVALALCISAVPFNIVAEENETENVVDSNEATETESVDNSIEYVAQVGNDKYEDLQSAIDAAKNNGSVDLLTSVILSSPLTIGKDYSVNINLSGHDISYTSDVIGEAMIANKGELTINDETNAGKISYQYTGNGDSTFGKGNYTITNSGKLTVNGGCIENNTPKITHAYYTIDNNSSGADAEIIINGGSVICSTSRTIRQFMANATNVNNLTIEGGYIEGTFAVFIQLAGSNSSIAPKFELNINDGTLRGTDEECGFTVYVYSDGNSAANGKINISGGTFEGDVAFNGKACPTLVKENISVVGGIFNGIYGGIFGYGDIPFGFISGGIFKSVPYAYYIADGYLLAENNENETFTVIENTYFKYLGANVPDAPVQDVPESTASLRYSYDFADDFNFTSWGWTFYAEGKMKTVKVAGNYITADKITRLVVTNIASDNWSKNVCADMWFEVQIDDVTYTVYDQTRTASVDSLSIA
ncbi:MAG: hypothetical protein IKJ00_02115 [Clostridia bacterium]|nr:hypothetical protein [Clostridia bacterium]